MSLKASLVSYWKLEEAAAATRVDSFGTNDLTDHNSVQQAAGKVNNCASFASASSRYLGIASNASLTTGNIDFTFQFWLNPTTLTNYPVAVRKADSGPREYSLFHNNDGGVDLLEWAIVTPGGTTIRARWTPKLSTSTWYHVLCYHDATNGRVGISVNNGTDVTALTGGAGVKSNGTGEFQIGGSSDQAIYWNGLIDEAAMWKRLLSPGERAFLYNGGNGRGIDTWDTLEYIESARPRRLVVVPELEWQGRAANPMAPSLMTSGVVTASDWTPVVRKPPAPQAAPEPAGRPANQPPVFLLTGGVIGISTYLPNQFRPKVTEPPTNAPKPFRSLGWFMDLVNVNPSPPGGLEKNKSLSYIHRVPKYEDYRRLAHAVDVLHQIVNSLVGQGVLAIGDDLATWRLLGAAHVDTRNPGAMDDGRMGFPVGAAWVNSVTSKIWFCVVNSDYAAQWVTTP